MGELSDEFLEENTSSFNKIRIAGSIASVNTFTIDRQATFLRNARNVASRPACGKNTVKSLKLIKSSLTGELAGGIASSDSVFCDLAYLYWVFDTENKTVLLRLIL